ncbi:hypothetical protein Pla22_22450 [Rubripirellula amarantea]|uniref:Uncharacterized protein n=1 Tax=Rubripirellula amarantea TaxID=2527999 RepID=A0A5C5WXI5_9BACT|nr:hypothetical protein [Rubripirellula amarantea]TWT54595.1 hypothetical protein Pla22_22450 [Rubripirellula amarantea]
MDADKIKNFFISHFEKMIFAAIVAVSGYLVYQGVGKENYLNKHQPDELIADANQVKLQIDEDHSEQVIAERKFTNDREIFEKTVTLYERVDPTHYPIKNAWADPGAEAVIRRQDPLLSPVGDIRTMGVVCSLSFAGAKAPDDYPAAKLEPADELEKAEKKKRPKRGSRNQPSMEEMMMGGMGGPSSEEMMMMMGGGPPPTAPKGKRGKNDDGRPTGPARKLNKKFDRGFAAVPESSTNNPQPKLGWFIAGTALLPHREIYEAYEMAFQDASGYNTSRDTPIYFDLQVQRADVSEKAVADLTDDDWKLIWDRFKYTLLASKLWSGYAPEIVEEDYRDENITMWIPPVLLDDYSDFATHPEIPLLSKADLKIRKLKELQGDDDDEAVNPDDFDLENAEFALTGPKTGARNFGAGPGGSGMMMGDPSMMMGGGMAMFGRGKVEDDPVINKLVRFYDFAVNPLTTQSAKPGRTYVYRLRYAVVDPNFPSDPSLQPKSSQLAAEVAARVMEKMNEARKAEKRDFSMWSPWSDPSDPVKLPSLQEAFAGSVDPGSISIWDVDGREVEYRRDAPTAELALTQMDMNTGVRAQILLKKVEEGSVLSHKTPAAQAVDPISLEVKKLPDYEILSGSTVIDLAGGTALSIVEDGLTQPSTMLIYDEVTGKLIVSDDVTDQFEFRMNSYADERGE